MSGDARGVLQDIRRSFGAVGYFRSHAPGSEYGAQFPAEMRKAADADGDLEKAMENHLIRGIIRTVWKTGAGIPAGSD
ncbi:MAG: hypothetical protein J5564_01555 [Clostridia bacterium]|nr:hypothetical protein [Clostridia bacterium]